MLYYDWSSIGANCSGAFDHSLILSGRPWGSLLALVGRAGPSARLNETAGSVLSVPVELVSRPRPPLSCAAGGRVTVYTRCCAAQTAWPSHHTAAPRSRYAAGLDEIEREDILIITAGHHTTTPKTVSTSPPELCRDGRRRDGGGVL